jgi:uncharacterized membrane protein
MITALGKRIYLLWALLLLGVGDSLFLTFNHFLNGGTPCSITNGCELVTTSSYSVIAGIPLALIGFFYYLTVLVLSVIYYDMEAKWAYQGVLYLTFAASLISIALILLQAFVLNAWCVYCLLSAFITFSLFLTAYFLHD